MKLNLFLLFACGSMVLASCNPCVECKGTKYCKEAGAVYTNDQGNQVSWEEYSAGIQQNCQ